jgi:hypothetical protein
MRFLILLVSWLFPIVIVAYLVMLKRLIAKLKSVEPEYWTQIASPSLLNPNGQAAVAKKIIFGVGLPDSIASAYKKEFAAVRILLSLGVILFIAIIAMMYGGAFDS